ncbi:MAG TPA: aminotransferase class V-fold PLP-dependent enzyme, partial [Chitinophagaceae bacterium]|nr:aminotransferase class V-fold PLP-dependent enzyme [Chitinophagaceae bacterium]
MPYTYLTPGPSALFPTYKEYMAEAIDRQLGSINHRSETFRSMYQLTDQALRRLMNIPDTHRIFFTSSATEIWERMILNCSASNSFHLVNGSFSKRFYEFALTLGRASACIEVNEGEGFEVEHLNIPSEYELICTTYNETSTGVQMQKNDLAVLKKQHPNSIVCSDCVSIAPCVDIDFNVADCIFFSVQKAFGLPPGLGVWIVNDACIDKAAWLKKSGHSIGAHHNLLSFEENYRKFETPCTPNVLSIFLLGKVAEEMNSTGIQKIIEESKIKADLLYHLAEEREDLRPFVQNRSYRSDTVI